ncbi:MAG: GNAT family N-acetyltransferase, partial [Saprospiraceae bacterium]
TLTIYQKAALLELWDNEYPAQLGYSDMAAFDGYLDKLINVEHFLVEANDGTIMGWYFHFLRDNAKWFVIILSSEIQGKGVGSALLAKAKKTETELFGWLTDHDRYKKRNGDVYRSPLGFYKKNGFEVLADERLELDKLSAVKIRWVKDD